MIQPNLSMVPRIKNNSVCPPLLSPFLLVLTPLILHLSLSLPSCCSTLHSSLPVSVPFSPIITSNRPRVTKSEYVARKKGMYGDKVPSNAWEMWFPIKLPKVMLQALDKQIVAAAAEGIFINKNKLIFVYVPWDILKKKKNYPIWKRFSSWNGKSRPR